ncbi:PQQ-binding-like beta-propeller repeat protein [Flavobacterium sp. AJR]|uniref:beta-alanine-activating enzyme beta-propeller domain-containing protein n=1 Tax=Flavobacterium sp. AJR TaxID=1979369 RepID=UPI000A3D8119|nr:PQQ-binding-like beta-propeller repeat protein [Flavobacterium sp. AJR]OUL60450.1 pyrrolo-quinoline quinone [Flavobacterium sp. AJR]
MKRLLALLPLYFFLVINNSFAQKNEPSIINSFSDRVFPGKGYLPLGDIKWKFKTDGKIFSSPIAKNGIVFIGSEDGFLYAIEEKSGNLKWKFKTNGAIHSSPSIYENTIFFGSFDGYYYAVNTTTGKEVWKFKTGGENWYSDLRILGTNPNGKPMDDLWDFYLSSPVVYKDNKSASVLFGSSDGNVYSLDAKKGSLNWKFKTEGPIHSTPVLDKNTLYIGSWDAKLYAINCKTGKEKWKFTTEDKIGFKGIQSSVAVADGMVYFGARDPHFFALDSETGKLIWKYDAESSWILSSAVILNNIIYVGTSDTYALLALDSKTGKELYRFRTSGYVYSSPAISGNTIYFGDFTGNFFSLDILSLGKISNFISTDSRKKHAAEILKNDQLDFTYAAKNSDLSQYKETKKVMDEFYKLGPIVSSPFISNNTVYFGSADGYFYAIGL